MKKVTSSDSCTYAAIRYKAQPCNHAYKTGMGVVKINDPLIVCVRIVRSGRQTQTDMEWCVHGLFITFLLVQLQTFGGSKSQSLGRSSPPIVSPTATANATSPTGLLRPRPRPRPPPPVSPSIPGTPLAPRSLLLGQCIVGAESAQMNHIVEFANADRLYVDVGRPAECGGVIARWEVCFGGHATPMASTNLQIAVFRPGNSEMVYHLVSVSNLSLVPGEPEAAEAICQSHDATTEVMVEQGDLIGFVSGDGVGIGLSTYNATRHLHVYIQNIQEGLLSALGTLQLSQLQQLRQAVVPLIRIVLSKFLILSLLCGHFMCL